MNLRFNALKRGLIVDESVDARFLERVLTKVCPVSLEPFDLTDLRRRPSIDRLLNEGTYAPGNICSLVPRVNQAKSDMTFHEVLSNAMAGRSERGLAPVEWMRLCSLMSGAWVAAGGKDPGLMPLATYPAPVVFTSQSHVIQNLLLRYAVREVVEPPAWLFVGEDQDWARLRSLWRLLVDQVKEEEYPPSLWLRAEPFAAFVSWYGPVQHFLLLALEALRESYQSGVDKGALVDAWQLGTRAAKEKG